MKIPKPNKRQAGPKGTTLLTRGSQQDQPVWLKPERPNWPLYLNLPEVPLRDAIALSLNLAPPPYIMDGTDKDFDDRLTIALAHMTPTGELRHVAVTNPAKLPSVRLADIAHLAEVCTPKWKLPPEFPAAIRPEAQKAPFIENKQKVSKAPPPIIPLDSSPPKPYQLNTNVKGPTDWTYWRHIETVELWQALLLSLNIEPPGKGWLLDNAAGPTGDIPYEYLDSHGLTDEFLRRCRLLQNRLETLYASIGKPPKVELTDFIRLPLFATWAVEFEWKELPPELVALSREQAVKLTAIAPNMSHTSGGEASNQTATQRQAAAMETEFMACFRETIYNGKGIDWRYWVHQMPELSAGEAVRLICGLDPEIFESLDSRPNKNDPTQLTVNAKRLQRLAERENMVSASPKKWLEWAEVHEFAVHIGFRYEVELSQKNRTREVEPRALVEEAQADPKQDPAYRAEYDRHCRLYEEREELKRKDYENGPFRDIKIFERLAAIDDELDDALKPQPIPPAAGSLRALLPFEHRAKIEITSLRGTRRRIVENWDDIEKEYGAHPDARQVLRVLKRDKDEKQPALKTVQNHLSVLRGKNLIP